MDMAYVNLHISLLVMLDCKYIIIYIIYLRLLFTYRPVSMYLLVLFSLYCPSVFSPHY